MSNEIQSYGLITASRTVPGSHSRWNQDESLVAPVRGVPVAAGKVGRFLLGGGPVFLAVADGVGSVPDTDSPAQQALRAAFDAIQSSDSSDRPPDVLENAFSAANRAVFPGELSEEELMDLWSYYATLTVAVVVGLQVWIGHIGDSRAYLARSGSLWRLTDDHTLVELVIRAGYVTPEEVAGHNYRHVMLETLGSRPNVRPSIFRLELEPGDRLILCTDGVSDVVLDEVLASAVATARDVKAACVNVIDAVLDRGVTDNATIVVAEVTGVRRFEVEEEVRAPVISVIHEVLAEHLKRSRASEAPASESDSLTAKEGTLPSPLRTPLEGRLTDTERAGGILRFLRRLLRRR